MENIALDWFNDTIISNATITEKCISWCSSQHFSFQHTEIIHAFTVIGVIALLQALLLIIIPLKDRIPAFQGDDGNRKHRLIIEFIITLSAIWCIIIAAYGWYQGRWGFLRA